MESINIGYQTKQYNQPVKRYCRTMELRDYPELISEYRRRHTKENAWREIVEGIKSVGILEMELYITGTRLVMIVDTPVDFDWDEAMLRLAQLPRQQEWEDYMSALQQTALGVTSSEKWHPMERMFHLYDY